VIELTVTGERLSWTGAEIGATVGAGGRPVAHAPRRTTPMERFSSRCMAAVD
jgi:hypothetical protein